MQLFVDNDILLKLASADLLLDLKKIFNVDDYSIYILPSAKYYISNNKRLRQKYSSEVIDKMIKTIANYSVIPDEFLDQNRFLKLANIVNIDSGEQILFSLKPLSEDYLIITGDKLSLQALFSNSDIKDIAEGLKSKIVCLEYIFLRLCELWQFNELVKKVRDSNFCGDKTIEIIFSQAFITYESVREGLFSYYNALNLQTNQSLFNRGI